MLTVQAASDKSELKYRGYFFDSLGMIHTYMGKKYKLMMVIITATTI